MVRMAAKGRPQSAQTCATAALSISTASASGSSCRSAALSAAVATKRSPLTIRPWCTCGACSPNSATAGAPSVRCGSASAARAACARRSVSTASVAKRERPVSGTSWRANSGEASRSCCSSSRATTTSPTRTAGASAPATPVNTIAAAPKRSISSTALLAAATLPMRDRLASTGRPCQWPCHTSRPAMRVRCSSGQRASTCASSSCSAARMAIGASAGSASLVLISASGPSPRALECYKK